MLKPETFLNMKSLVEVNLDHNNIVDLDANLFAGNPDLKFVFMRYNGIKTVPAFDSNTQLKIAYLSHNMIESLNLSNLEHLKRVDVGDNTFTELNDNALSGSTGNLEFMYANAKYGSQSHQKLNQVGDHVLDGAAKLKVVDFADNSLNESQIKFVPQVVNDNGDSSQLSIDLRRNAFADAKFGKKFVGTSELNQLAADVNEAANQI